MVVFIGVSLCILISILLFYKEWRYICVRYVWVDIRLNRNMWYRGICCRLKLDEENN